MNKFHHIKQKLIYSVDLLRTKEFVLAMNQSEDILFLLSKHHKVPVTGNLYRLTQNYLNYKSYKKDSIFLLLDFIPQSNGNKFLFLSPNQDQVEVTLFYFQFYSLFAPVHMVL